MLSYNRIGYEIDSVKLLPPSEVLGISFLHHFNVDYPETWQFNGSAALNQSVYKFGGCSVYFPDSSSNVTITNTTGMFDIDVLGSYEFEAFVRPSATGGNILSLSGSFKETASAATGNLTLNLTLSVSDEGVLSLSSTAFDFEGTAATALSVDTWHHILLRITDGYVKVFLDGAEVLTKLLYRDGILSPTAVTLGGYVGYMDEFAFRRNAGSSAPTVPTTPYDTNVVIQPIEVLVEVPSATTNNAPVSRAAWSCANLPEGLTLSSAGVLSGHPTTAGTYECNVSVATNWGTNTKTIRIVIE